MGYGDGVGGGVGDGVGVAGGVELRAVYGTPVVGTDQSDIMSVSIA